MATVTYTCFGSLRQALDHCMNQTFNLEESARTYSTDIASFTVADYRTPTLVESATRGLLSKVMLDKTLIS